MTDSLRSVGQRSQVAAERAAEATAVRKAHPWGSMSVEARAAVLSMVFLGLGTIAVVLGVGFLIGIVVSAGAGMASGAITLGIVFLLIGVLFGLDKS